MLETGERIRAARQALGLTVEQLAKYIGVTKRTITRYESGQSTPETYAIKKLACVFDLSSDYLLGLSNRKDTCFLNEYRQDNLFCRRVIANSPIPNETYYWVQYDAESEAFPQSGQMSWAGMDKQGRELYCLRPITVEFWLDVFKRKILPGKTTPFIVNTPDDFYVFLAYGGDAFICEAVCKEYLGYLLRPGPIVEKDNARSHY